MTKQKILKKAGSSGLLAFYLLSSQYLSAQGSITAGYTQSDFYQGHIGYEKLTDKNLYSAEVLINFYDGGEPSQRAWENNWKAITFWQTFGLGLKYGRKLYSYEKTRIHVVASARVTRLGVRSSIFDPTSTSSSTVHYEYNQIEIKEPFWALKPQLQFQISYPISKSLYMAVGGGAGFTFIYNHLKGPSLFIVDGVEPGIYDQVSYSAFAQLQYRFPKREKRGKGWIG